MFFSWTRLARPHFTGPLTRSNYWSMNRSDCTTSRPDSLKHPVHSSHVFCPFLPPSCRWTWSIISQVFKKVGPQYGRITAWNGAMWWLRRSLHEETLHEQDINFHCELTIKKKKALGCQTPRSLNFVLDYHAKSAIIWTLLCKQPVCTGCLHFSFYQTSAQCWHVPDIELSTAGTQTRKTLSFSTVQLRWTTVCILF